MIKIKDLTYKYKDGTIALDNINLALTKRKIAIMGANGSGKSTLLLHLNGVHIPQKGEIKIFNLNVNRKNSDILKTKVGIVFQDPDDQVFSTTVWEDVSFGPVNMGYEGKELEDRVNKALNKVDMLKYRDKYPHNLSYGQKKKVALAGVLAMDFDILVLDEPIAYLDPIGQEELLLILDELYKQGKIIIIATHDVDLASEWSEEIVVLKDGKVLAKGDNNILINEKLMKEGKLRIPTISKFFLELGYKEGIPVTISEGKRVLEEKNNLKNNF